VEALGKRWSRDGLRWERYSNDGSISSYITLDVDKAVAVPASANRTNRRVLDSSQCWFLPILGRVQ
jgi:hypothetical protein